MSCVKHNLRMVRLVLRGRTQTPEHAALLADVRRCRRCGHPERTLPVHSYVRIPRARAESVQQRLHAGRS
jgi:hypothetical protein